MIIHHMSDGSIRKSMDGVIIPRNFEKIYTLANHKKKEIQNGNCIKSKTINKQ